MGSDFCTNCMKQNCGVEKVLIWCAFGGEREGGGFFFTDFCSVLSVFFLYGSTCGGVEGNKGTGK